MDFGGWIGVLWVLSGIVGVVLLLAKGKLRLGFVGWMLLGWWGTIFGVIFGGGLLLLWGLLAKSPTRCTACRKEIDRQATKCPYCQTVLVVPAPSQA